jgi:VacB/RNase II family 3'-5' exoribonuclease
MKIAKEAQESLAAGFASIIEQFDLPLKFPEAVLLAADHSVAAQENKNQSSWQQHRQDLTDLPFVTLDPASSTDLDQAFTLKREGKNIILYYALADVSAFVPADGVLEAEAWNRGLTIYGVADKLPLYPKAISQHAASLLPDGPRPAVLVVVVIDPNGGLKLRSVDRIICKSRAKLAYDKVDLSTLPYLEEFATRMWEAETERGAIRVDFPQQEVVTDPSAPGGVRLELRVRLQSELVNSALSLAVNMAIGTLLRDTRIGLFRVMDDPDPKALAMLRRAARALHIVWDRTETLRDLQKRMDTGNAVHQKFLVDARRAGGRAYYALYSGDKIPWHSAIAATYAHATAPMRRLADRYVLDLTCHVANGRSVPDELANKLEQLPKIMEHCEGRAANVDRAVIDLLEAVSLQHRIGDILEAEIVDADNSIVQTFDSAIRHRASNLSGVENGDMVRVRIDGADPANRTIRLTAVK